MTELVVEIDVPDSSTHEPPSKPAQDLPTPATDLPAERAADESENPEAPSPVRTDDPQNTNVEISKV